MFPLKNYLLTEVVDVMGALYWLVLGLLGSVVFEES